MLGQRCGPGTAKSTYGTGCFVLLHTGPRAVASAHGLLTTVAYRLGSDAEPQYALEVGGAELVHEQVLHCQVLPGSRILCLAGCAVRIPPPLLC